MDVVVSWGLGRGGRGGEEMEIIKKKLKGARVCLKAFWGYFIRELNCFLVVLSCLNMKGTKRIYVFYNSFLCITFGKKKIWIYYISPLWSRLI